METILPVSAGQIFIQRVVWFSDFSRGGRVFLHAGVCFGVLRLGRGLEGGVGVCRIVLVVVWGVFPSYNSTGISLPHPNNITDHNQRPTRHPPPLLCYQKNLSPCCLKIFYVSTPADFLNWFLEQCPVNLSPQLSILAREGKRNKCLLWFGFATWSHEQSNAKGKSQHQHQIGNKESRSPLHATPGPGSNKIGKNYQSMHWLSQVA